MLIFWVQIRRSLNAEIFHKKYDFSLILFIAAAPRFAHSLLFLLVSSHRPEPAPPTVFLTPDITISRVAHGTVSEYKLYFFLLSAMWHFDGLIYNVGPLNVSKADATASLLHVCWYHTDRKWADVRSASTQQSSLARFSPHLHYPTKLS